MLSYYITVYYIILYYIILYSILFYSIILYCIVLYYIVLYHVILYCIILYCMMSYYIMLFYIILYIIYIHIWLETTNQPFLADGFTSPFGTWWERWTDGQMDKPTTRTRCWTIRCQITRCEWGRPKGWDRWSFGRKVMVKKHTESMLMR